MVIADHHRWDHENANYGINEINSLANHFSEPLKFHDFNLHAALFEFRQLKKLVHGKYSHMQQPTSLWNVMCQKNTEAFPNTLLLIEIILCISCSSSIVEHGFSTLNRILTASHVSLGKKHIDDIMLFRVNVPTLATLDPNYEEKLVQKTVNNYLKQKCYHKTKLNASKKQFKGRNDVTTLEDLFLPQKRARVVNNKNVLLIDEGYLEISDSSGNESNKHESSADEEDLSAKE